MSEDNVSIVLCCVSVECCLAFSCYYPGQEGPDWPCDRPRSSRAELVNIVKILHTFSLCSPTSPPGASLPVIRKMRIHICYEILLTHKNENVPKIPFFTKD